MALFAPDGLSVEDGMPLNTGKQDLHITAWNVDELARKREGMPTRLVTLGRRIPCGLGSNMSRIPRQSAAFSKLADGARTTEAIAVLHFWLHSQQHWSRHANIAQWGV